MSGFVQLADRELNRNTLLKERILEGRVCCLRGMVGVGVNCRGCMFGVWEYKRERERERAVSLGEGIYDACEERER